MKTQETAAASLVKAAVQPEVKLITIPFGYILSLKYINIIYI
jgi:hypothetical protein